MKRRKLLFNKWSLLTRQTDLPVLCYFSCTEFSALKSYIISMRIFCSICKDIFIPYSEVHVTNCGHLYHGSCISTWIKQHRTCPQCRANLSKPFRVFFDVDKDNDADPSTLEHQIEILSDKLREVEREKKNLLEENKSSEKIAEGIKECAISLSKKNDVLKTYVKALKEQVNKLSKQNEAVTNLESELKTLKSKLSTLERVETIIEGSVDEVNKMIEATPVSIFAINNLCTYVGILKAQLQKIESKNIILIKENRDLTKTIAEEKRKHSNESEEVIDNLQKKNTKLEKELLSLKILHKDCQKKLLKEKEDAASQSTNSTKMQNKKSFLNLDLETFDEERKEILQRNSSIERDKTINNWEELVCAGPSRNFGLSLKQSKPFNKMSFFKREDKEELRSNTAYAFDGLGGRKKLRLGSPTPTEEFEKIKKKKEKKFAPTFQHKKIIEYYQIE